MKNQLFVLILILSNGILFAAGDPELEKALKESEEDEFQKAIRASEDEAQLKKVLEESEFDVAKPSEDPDLEAALAESRAYAESAQASGKKEAAKVSPAEIEDNLAKLNQMLQEAKKTGKMHPHWFKTYGFTKDLIQGLPENDQVQLLRKTGFERRLKNLKYVS